MMHDFMMEETFSPSWPDDQRVPYALIMLRIFDGCNSYCQSKLKGLLNPAAKGPTGWRSNENGLAWTYEQLECSFSFHIEELMLEVAHMILDGGRSFDNEQWMNYHRAKIQAILQKNDLQAMLAELPQPERDYFESDLNLLAPLGLFGSLQQE